MNTDQRSVLLKTSTKGNKTETSANQLSAEFWNSLTLNRGLISTPQPVITKGGQPSPDKGLLPLDLRCPSHLPLHENFVPAGDEFSPAKPSFFWGEGHQDWPMRNLLNSLVVRASKKPSKPFHQVPRHGFALDASAQLNGYRVEKEGWGRWGFEAWAWEECERAERILTPYWIGFTKLFRMRTCLLR